MGDLITLFREYSSNPKFVSPPLKNPGHGPNVFNDYILSPIYTAVPDSVLHYGVI